MFLLVCVLNVVFCQVKMRRFPVYFLLDTSKSMRGEKIEAVQNCVRTILSALRKNPYALETTWLSIIIFGSEVKQIVPLTDIVEFHLPVLTTGGATSLGGALKMVTECAKREVRKRTVEDKGDYRPVVFLLTDGYPTDDFQSGLDAFKKCKWGNVVACAAGCNADISALQKITENIVVYDGVDVSTISRYFSPYPKYYVGLVSAYDRYDAWDWEEEVNQSELPPPPKIMSGKP